MRKPIMAGNWKMNKTVAESTALAQALAGALGGIDSVECVVCPTLLALTEVSNALAGSNIQVGAQNVHWADSGAYTGEVSAPMLKEVVSHVIIGHSERREYYEENDEEINKKVLNALRHGLTPIVCVGETEAQNAAAQTHNVVSAQIVAALSGVEPGDFARVIIAYEPIWAIGTGRAATADEAQATCCNTVRTTLSALYGDELAQKVRILYGGSTNPKNIGEIMQQPDIDGALIGGASLKADDYSAMVKTTAALYQQI